MATHEAGVLDAARTAYERRDWAQAFAQLTAADAHTPLLGDDLERLAISAYRIGRDADSLGTWTRAHHQFVEAGNLPRAARCAFWMVVDLLMKGEAARANGWLARAQRLFDDAHADCPERGLILILVARLRNRAGDVRGASDLAATHGVRRIFAIGFPFASSSTSLSR